MLYMASLFKGSKSFLPAFILPNLCWAGSSRFGRIKGIRRLLESLSSANMIGPLLPGLFHEYNMTLSCLDTMRSPHERRQDAPPPCIPIIIQAKADETGRS